MGNVQVSAKVEDAQTYITITITDVGNFCDLNRTINGNDYTEITLNKNYTYNPETENCMCKNSTFSTLVFAFLQDELRDKACNKTYNQCVI